MHSKRKKIALLFAGGGSLLSIKGNKSVFFVEQADDAKRWLEEIPELSILADMTPWFNAGESDGWGIERMESVFAYLQNEEKNFDGFVVLCRAERVLAVSAACEFMLQGFSKPVIFTGSRYSPEAVAIQDLKVLIKMGGLGLRSNVINAVQVAVTDGFPVKAIMFGNRLIKPTKAVVAEFRSINLFKSADDDYLGRVDFGLAIHRNKYQALGRKSFTKLSRKVLPIGLGLLTHSLETVLASKSQTEYLLVHLDNNETIDVETLGRLRQRFRQIYAFSTHYLLEQPAGVIPLPQLTWETALAKLMWAVEAFPAEDVASVMNQDLIGEKLAL